MEAKLVPGRNGIFDVIVDGEMVFSKFKIGRLPVPFYLGWRIVTSMRLTFIYAAGFIIVTHRMILRTNMKGAGR